MPTDNKLELVIEVQADKANAQIKGVNQGLAGIEPIAVSVAKNASTGIDGMTASMTKGALAGNLLAEAIKGAASWTKNWITEAAQMAAHEEKIWSRTISPTSFGRQVAAVGGRGGIRRSRPPYSAVFRLIGKTGFRLPFSRL